MTTFVKQRIRDASFAIDRDLNIKDANRSFLRFLNLPYANDNISNYIDEADSINFKSFLNNYKEENRNKYFIANIRTRKESLDCLFIVTEYTDELFYINLKELEYTKEVLYKTTLQNEEYRLLMSNINTNYFIYDCLNKSIIFKNTREVASIYEGTLVNVKTVLEHIISINFDDEVTFLTYNSLIEDLVSHVANKSYKFQLKDKSNEIIYTKSLKTNDNVTHIIGLVGLDYNIELQDNQSNKLDGLTLLFNKTTITDLAKRRIDESKTPTSLIVLDIDNFKACNDNFGHVFGDEVLINVARVIKETIGNSGYAGRIGGDEFLCVIDEVEEESLRNILRNIRLGLQWSIPASTPDTVVSCSIGVSRFPLNSSNFEDMFDLADKMLYIAKNKGRNCYVIYKPEIHNKVIETLNVEKTRIKNRLLYSEIAKQEREILDVVYKRDPGWQVKSQNLLLKYLNASKMTIYDKNLNLKYINGIDYKDIRKTFIHEDDYFKYVNEDGVFIIENTNNLDTIDKVRYRMYLDAKVGSAIEILCRDEFGNVRGAIAYDVYKPARSFKEYKLPFIILVSNLICENM